MKNSIVILNAKKNVVKISTTRSVYLTPSCFYLEIKAEWNVIFAAYADSKMQKLYFIDIYMENNP